MSEDKETSPAAEYAETMVDEYQELAADPDSRGTMLVGVGPQLGAFATGDTDGKRETYVAMCSSLLVQFTSEEEIDQKEFVRDVIEDFNDRKKTAAASTTINE